MTSGLRILILSIVPALTGTRAQPLAVTQLLIFENTPLSALTGLPGQVTRGAGWLRVSIPTVPNLYLHGLWD